MAALSDRDLIRAGTPWSDRLAAGSDGIDPSVRATEEDWRRWQRCVDPDDAGLFTRRLALDHLSEADARRMLGGTPPQAEADWLAELTTLRDAVRRRCGEPADPLLVDVPFAPLVTPMVDDVWTRLTAACDDSVLTDWMPAARAALRHDLATRIAEVAAACWYADFSDARPSGAALMGRLGVADGENSRFREWCDDASADGLSRLLTTYPVLGRLLAVTTTTWTAATIAMLERVHRHRDDLADILAIASETPITAVTPGLSDRHRGGHSVAIIGFASGQKVVYKPKDLHTELQFNRLVAEVNAWFGDTALHEIDVITGEGAYGFTGHMAYAPCPVPEMPQFYRAAGRLLALLHFLGATDAHYENVIAAGRSLALIDPETLFHCDVGETEAAELADTVLRTGMLPSWSLAGPDQLAFDGSALGVEISDTMQSRFGWAHVNTDAIVWARLDQGPAARPSLPSQTQNPLRHHVDHLVAGFRDVHQACQEPGLRDILLAAVPRFRGLRQRVVLRATRVYALLQQKAMSAQSLRAANSRAMELERLTRFALVGDTSKPWWAVFHAEVLEMEHLDIPFFEYRLGSAVLDSRAGPIQGMSLGDPLADATARIEAADGDDLRWQERLIRGSVRARYATVDGQTTRHTGPVTHGTARAVTQAAELLSAIDHAAVHRPGADPSWLTLSLLPDGRHVRLGLIGDSWYDGRAGLAGVLQWAAEQAVVPEDAADRTAAPVMRMLRSSDSYVRFRYLRNLGLGFTGVGGLLRWLLLTEPQGPVLRGLVEDLPVELVERDRHYDLIGGVAGLIGPMARIVREQPTPHAVDLIAGAARHLAAAQRDDGGWPSTMGPRPLTGLAHGAAGNGWALLDAGVALQEQAWIDAGAAAFEYEHSVFDPVAGNWPDLRAPDGQQARVPMVAWCHGAAGIGLTRFQALRLLPEHPAAPQWRRDLETAMRTTSDAAVPPTDHLCCGLCGRAAVLRIVGRGMDDPRWLEASERLTSVALQRAREEGRFGLPLDDVADMGSISPGLMTGLAGIAAHLVAADSEGDLSAFLL